VEHLELLLLGLLTATAALAVLARLVQVPYEGRADSYREFMGHVFGAQRERLRLLRDQGHVTDEVRRRVEYDLDLEEARLST